MKTGSFLSCVVAFLFLGAVPSCGGDESASEMIDARYCAGIFTPENDTRFVRLSSKGIDVRDPSLVLRAETVDALSRMFAEFKKEHPGVPVWVQSATRTFDSQKSIWNRKWKSAEFAKYRDPADRARAILRFSSMPGTSRHHWGTDFDINVLTNEYYKKGQGKILFDWLEKNARQYGFARPFTAGRNKGYMEEKWHWSYLPLARECYRSWIACYGNDLSFFTKKGLFEGSEVSGAWALEYVTSINPECQ
jgi:D-alanyl-D-alanine carboxypeptidase